MILTIAPCPYCGSIGDHPEHGTHDLRALEPTPGCCRCAEEYELYAEWLFMEQDPEYG